MPTLRSIAAATIAVALATSAAASALQLPELGHGLPPAPGELSLHETLFQKLCAAVRPVIVEEARKITVPGHKEKHFDYGTIRLSSFDIGAIDVDFHAPSTVSLALKGLRIGIDKTSFQVKDTIMWTRIGCKGHVWATIEDAVIVANVALGRNHDGRMEVTGVTDSTAFGRISIGHRFDHEICRIAGHILSLFLGNLNHRLEDMVKHKIGPVIVKQLRKSLDAAVPKLPLDLMSAPRASSHGISFTVNVLSLLQHSKKGLGADAILGQGAAAALGSTSRDVSVTLSSSSGNILMRYALEAGYFRHVVKTKFTTDVFKHYLPAAYKACPGCRVRVPWDFKAAPELTFLDALTFSLRGAAVSLEAIDPKGHAVPLVDLYGNVTGMVRNFTTTGKDRNVLHMAVGVPTLSFRVTRSAVGPFDAWVIPKLADFAVRDVVVPFVNAVLNAEGIHVPTFADAITPSDILLQFVDAKAYLGANVILK